MNLNEVEEKYDREENFWNEFLHRNKYKHECQRWISIGHYIQYNLVRVKKKKK